MLQYLPTSRHAALKLAMRQAAKGVAYGILGIAVFVWAFVIPVLGLAYAIQLLT